MSLVNRNKKSPEEIEILEKNAKLYEGVNVQDIINEKLSAGGIDPNSNNHKYFINNSILNKYRELRS